MKPNNFRTRCSNKGLPARSSCFIWDLVPFQDLAGEASGTPVASYQRVDQAGVRLPIDERILADTDTLLIFGLDHIATSQDAAPEEVAALREFLKREGTVLLIGPHHDVGATDDFKQRDMEYRHHGDRLVPSQQRFSTYTRGLLKGLGIPVENQWGLRPATVEGTRTPVPLLKATDLDTRGWLEGVTNFVFHQHLPHYAVTGGDSKSIHVLARQPVNLGPSASVHGCRQHGVQHVPVDAAVGRARGRHHHGRLDALCEPLRWR